MYPSAEAESAAVRISDPTPVVNRWGVADYPSVHWFNLFARSLLFSLVLVRFLPHLFSSTNISDPQRLVDRKMLFIGAAICGKTSSNSFGFFLPKYLT